MELLENIVSWSVIVTIIIQFILKLVPNEKLWNIGYNFGKTTTIWGRGKFGLVYEKVEEYFQQSFGVLFESISSGLDSDEDGDKKMPEKYETKKDRVRK